MLQVMLSRYFFLPVGLDGAVARGLVSRRLPAAVLLLLLLLLLDNPEPVDQGVDALARLEDGPL